MNHLDKARGHNGPTEAGPRSDAQPPSPPPIAIGSGGAAHHERKDADVQRGLSEKTVSLFPPSALSTVSHQNIWPVRRRPFSSRIQFAEDKRPLTCWTFFDLVDILWTFFDLVDIL